MKHKKHLLVIDPTAFPGGSKIATENILNLLEPNNQNITILTADKDSWSSDRFRCVSLYQPDVLSKKVSGIMYFLRHLVIALSIVLIRLRYGKIDIAVGASGPGVDLSIYITQFLLKYRIVQLIHGPVALSRTIGKCLKKADSVFYLPSTKESLIQALYRADPLYKMEDDGKFKTLNNGLANDNWPSQCQYNKPQLFWAASLLKWKGLDTFISALHFINDKSRPETHICYIKPKDISISVSQAPVKINNVYWHDNPVDIDSIRKQANIFVSTSRNEPFGLSILESLAAGHCVLIPEDGSYWDKTLTNEIDCIKYTPDSAHDIANKLIHLNNHPEKIQIIGQKASHLAKTYKAKNQYNNIINDLASSSNDVTSYATESSL